MKREKLMKIKSQKRFWVQITRQRTCRVSFCFGLESFGNFELKSFKASKAQNVKKPTKFWPLRLDFDWTLPPFYNSVLAEKSKLIRKFVPFLLENKRKKN